MVYNNLKSMTTNAATRKMLARLNIAVQLSRAGCATQHFEVIVFVGILYGGLSGCFELRVSLGYSVSLFVFTTCSRPQWTLSYARGRFPLFSVSTCHVSCLRLIMLPVLF